MSFTDEQLLAAYTTGTGDEPEPGSDYATECIAQARTVARSRDIDHATRIIGLDWCSGDDTPEHVARRIRTALGIIDQCERCGQPWPEGREP